MLVALLLVGCGGGEDDALPAFAAEALADTTVFARDAADRARALALLDTVQAATMDSAFARLDRVAFTRMVRTSQVPEGGASATVTQVLRYGAGNDPAAVVRADTAGTFPEGRFLASTPDLDRRPTGLAADAVPSGPAYANPRTQAAYAYAVRRDTLSGGVPVLVVEARLRPDAAQRPAIRRARLFLTPDTHALVGLDVVRVNRSLLFDETSRITVELRRGPEGTAVAGAWVPRLVRTHAEVGARLRDPLRLETLSAFYDYGE